MVGFIVVIKLGALNDFQVSLNDLSPIYCVPLAELHTAS